MATTKVHILNAFGGKPFCGFQGPWTENGHWWVLLASAKNATCKKCKAAMAAVKANKGKTSPTTVQEV